jgi:hypothetical protein
MPRPGGNPLLKKYQFTTDREDPLIDKMTLRMGSRMKAVIRDGNLSDWQEIARQALYSAISERLGEDWETSPYAISAAHQLQEKKKKPSSD